MPDYEKFIQEWEQTALKERASAQSHFEAVCRLVGHELPHEKDPTGEYFTYEYSLKKSSGAQGYADVWYKDHFAIEYKGKGKYESLDDAYQQLLRYKDALHNPPLLVVCDIDRWEIHTNWTNTEPVVYKFTLKDLRIPKYQRALENMFFHPERLKPGRDKEQVTKEAAAVFHTVADEMRKDAALRGEQPDDERIARFLTKLVFCLFAEDVDLLPSGPGDEDGIFTYVLRESRTSPGQFVRYMHDLFQAMADGGDVLMKRIPYFNGRLFDNVDVEALRYETLTALEAACRLDWSAVEPAIFGTLFERSLDERKRAQLGAHYTGRDDIERIVRPVLMTPLEREWAAVQAEALPVRAKYDTPGITGREQQKHRTALEALRERILHRLRDLRVLDPACGSGNFLYVSLQLLLDMEKQVIQHPLWDGLTLTLPEVSPAQLYGIEKDAIAHALASIVVWIGYIQWHRNNGYKVHREPILKDLGDNIRRMDAILTSPLTSPPAEPEWPDADVIVSNPPFLGDKKMRGELGDAYVDALRTLYDGRVPGGADLVCYWFEKARALVAKKPALRVGMISTNSIRGGANRELLRRIKDTGDIFAAWADREWVQDGASVRVSMTMFDGGAEKTRTLDGLPVDHINADLTGNLDITQSNLLVENMELAFQGPVKVGAFDIPSGLAYTMLKEVNPTGVSNRDILKPYLNASDIVRTSRNYWIIDFGIRTEDEAKSYLAPYKYLEEKVKPIRATNRDNNRRTNWWRLGRSGEDYKMAVAGLHRQIFSPRVAKHRVFVWVDNDVLPDSRVLAIARDDDYFFGVLHSRIHEVWSLRQASRHGVGNDPTYNAHSCFETFPFPWVPGEEQVSSAAYERIAAAAKALAEERSAWLNGAKSGRTLTGLYNALAAYRGQGKKGKLEPAAGDFAPRLDVLHTALDKAVCSAYGWPLDVLADDEAILRRVLALNLERGEGSPPPPVPVDEDEDEDEDEEKR